KIAAKFVKDVSKLAPIIDKRINGADRRLDAQSEVATAIVDARQEQAEIVDSYLNELANNPNLKRAEPLTMTPELGFSSDQDAKSIIESNPDYKETKQIDNIAEGLANVNTLLVNGIGPNGSLTLSLADLRSEMIAGFISLQKRQA